MTRWVERLKPLRAWHVIFVPISNRFETNRPDIVLPALAAELGRYLGKRVEQPPVGAVEAYRDIVTELLDCFRSEPQRRCLLVIDGADEAQLAAWSLGRNLLPAAPPAGLCILVSARRLGGDHGARGWRARLGWDHPDSRVEELELGLLPICAVRDLVRTSLRDVHSVKPSAAPAANELDELTTQIFRLSEHGDPLLVELYAGELRAVGAAPSAPLSSLTIRLRHRTPGLKGYFEHWMGERRQLFAAAERSGAASVEIAEAALVVLACARGPLSHADLISLLRRVVPGEGLPARDDLLLPLSRFVAGDGKMNGYTLAHPRFGDFLREEQYTGTPIIVAAEEAFLAWGEDVLRHLPERSPSDGVPSYIVAWYPWHLLQARDRGPARLLPLLSRQWVETCRAVTGSDVNFASAAEAVLEELLATVERSGEVDGLVVSAALRAGLFLASLREASGTIGSSLLVEALRVGVLGLDAVLARLQLLDPRARAEVSLELACDRGLDVDRLGLWRDARVAAAASKDPWMLERVARATRELSGLLRDEQLGPLWAGLMDVVEERLRALEIGASPGLFLVVGSNLALDALPPDLRPELLRRVLSAPFGVGLRIGVVAGLLAAEAPRPAVAAADECGVAPSSRTGTNLLRELYRRTPPGAGPRDGEDRLAEIFEVATHELRLVDAGRSAYSVTRIGSTLEGLEKPENAAAAAEVVLAVLATEAMEPERSATVTTLGLVALDQLRRLLGNTGLVSAIASMPVEGLPEPLQSEVLMRGWAAALAVQSDVQAIRAATAMLIRMKLYQPEGPGTKRPSVQELLSMIRRGLGSIETEMRYDTESLIRAGSALLRGEDCKALLLDLSGSDDATRRITKVLEGLGATSGQREETAPAADAGMSDGRETLEPSDSIREEHVRELLARAARDDTGAWQNALEEARRIQSRRIRARALANVAQRAPEAERAAAIAEALKESGGIDDEDVVVQAMVGLARRSERGLTSAVLNEARDRVAKLARVDALHAIGNISYDLPKAERARWAALAMDMLSHVSTDFPEYVDLAARLVTVFPECAPQSLVWHCLRNATSIADEAKAVQVLQVLLRGPTRSALPAAAVSLARMGHLAAPMRTALHLSIVQRYTALRLVLWPVADAVATVSPQFSHKAYGELDIIATAAQVGRGSERAAALRRSLDHLKSLIAAGQERVFTHEFSPLYELLILGGPAFRDEAMAVIEASPASARKVHFLVSAYPALTAEQRAALGPKLLALLAQLPEDGSRGTDNGFRRVSILFRQWTGGGRRRPLLVLLRAAPTTSRRTWLYEVPQCIEALRALRQTVPEDMLEAVQDAARLWP